MKTNIDKVAANVRGIRAELGLTQQALADKVKISRVYLAIIEGASREPTLTVLDRIAKALKVKVGELLE